jgi:hypothetical protein
LHSTSISNFRFSLRSGSWCSSARTFIIDIVHGFGGLNTCKRSRENLDRYTYTTVLVQLHCSICIYNICYEQSSLWQIFGKSHKRYKLKHIYCLILLSNFNYNWNVSANVSKTLKFWSFTNMSLVTVNMLYVYTDMVKLQGR